MTEAASPPGDAPIAARPAVRPDLEELAGYHSPQVDVAVRLNTNEAPGPPPPGFADAVAAELSRLDWHRYPDRAATDLRRAIAAHHQVAPEQVFAANGSNEVLQTLLLTYGGPGRVAATFEPTYALHSHIARITGTGVVHGERGSDFTLDAATAAGVIHEHRPHVVFLCSPNNPTGLVEPPDLIGDVLQRAGGVGAVLVVDEAYGQFAPWSALDLIDEAQPLVVTRTFSKTWSMAAARLGYLVGPSWLVNELDKVVLPYHLDAVKQVAGRVALRYEAEMAARVESLRAERDRVGGALREMAVTVWPSGANFILFRPEWVPGAEVWQQLLDRSVLVRNCASWPRLEGCLRVTLGTPSENDAFLSALREILG